jgi:hypothetical protein
MLHLLWQSGSTGCTVKLNKLWLRTSYYERPQYFSYITFAGSSGHGNEPTDFMGTG